ncbi:8896_t:CDS:2 [Ambispora leptoticha]|uniref:8896_t:CDS:1 n=1 Tax=Ambispora leptoticha TaxID=144679 RepID=A0A9N9AJV7_9GLOM|nr:8896_t:CDS:2 [Ambispora leptoticha]
MHKNYISGRRHNYERTHHFLEMECGCGCSIKMPKKEFAELREDFQALNKPEQDIFLMAQLRSMDEGAINTSRHLKNKFESIRGLSTDAHICRNYYENIRNHLLKNGLLSRVHAVKDFLLNYTEVHSLSSTIRNVNRVTQSIIFVPAEMSYESVHRDFLIGVEKDNNLRASN